MLASVGMSLEEMRIKVRHGLMVTVASETVDSAATLSKGDGVERSVQMLARRVSD